MYAFIFYMCKIGQPNNGMTNSEMEIASVSMEMCEVYLDAASLEERNGSSGSAF